jgi:hypothetical protein
MNVWTILLSFLVITWLKNHIKPVVNFLIYLSSAPQVKLQAFVPFFTTGLCQCRADRNAWSSQCPVAPWVTHTFYLFCGTCRAGSSYIHTPYTSCRNRCEEWRIRQIEPTVRNTHCADVTPPKISPHQHELLFTIRCCHIYPSKLCKQNTFIAIGLFCPSPRLPAQVIRSIRVHGHYVWADSHGLDLITQSNRTGDNECK